MYPIIIAQEHHIHQIVEITNDEAKRSAATVASQDEPLDRWIKRWRVGRHYDPWLVAIDSTENTGQEVIGYAKASPYNVRDGFKWSVSLSIYIRPSHAGRGLGKSLYNTLFPLLSVQGYQRVYARIALPNPASRSLHQHFGLTQTGLLPQFAWKFGQWFDMGIFTGSLVDELNHSHSKEEPSSPQMLVPVDQAWGSLKKHNLLSETFI